MAYQIFWKIPFKSLRSGIVYTVNVYKNGTLPTGYPLKLKGASQPFVTEENDDNDIFMAVRTQSGYLRVVDDGQAVNTMGETVSFDWKDLMPATDTDRPVTLTHVEDGTNIIDWQGFLQAQNFDGELYGNPQERSFPVQCAFATLSRTDVEINYVNGIKNFASLLKYAIDSIPYISFDEIIIQTGASDARSWLLKKFDWSLFAEENDDGTLSGKYDILTAIEGMCRYWGWALRTAGKTIHLNCVDDSSATNFLKLTMDDLEDLAGGTSAGVIDSGGYETQNIGNIFASRNNSDRYVRGYNKATVSSDAGEIDSKIAYAYPRPTMEWMYGSGFTPYGGDREYSNNTSSFSTDLMEGSGPSGTLCLRKMSGEVDAVVRVLSSTVQQSIRFRTKIIHDYKDGFFRIKGKAEGENRHVVLRLYVGDWNSTYGNTMYWDGTEWTDDSSSTFNVTIGEDNIVNKISTEGLTIPEGYVSLHFIHADGETDFDIQDFELVFQRNNDITYLFGRQSSHDYKSKNTSMVKNEWSDSTIFATDNYSVFGSGVLLNPNGSYFDGWNYGLHVEGTTKPEQYLADRVASFGSLSKRMLRCELRNDQLQVAITPHFKVTLNSAFFYPFFIGHDWRDDILTLGLIEL